MLNDTLWRRALPLCLGILSLVVGAEALAQEHFVDCAHRTESNATVILPDSLELQIDGHEPKGPLEIAVFTPENECAGSSTWDREAVALTAWGSAPTSMSTEKALHPGDSLYVRLYDSSCGVEYNRFNSTVEVNLRDDGPPSVTEPQYAPDGIYILEKIVLRSLFLSPSDSCPRQPGLLPPSPLHPKANGGIAQSHTAAKQN